MDNLVVEPQIHREHGGEVFSWARKLGLQAAEILDFSASINALGPPASARKAFMRSYGELSRYPDAQGEALKEALAGRHSMNPEEILLGNGSTQLIYLVCRTFRPRKALVVVPAFSEYANALKLEGAEIRFFPLVPEENFSFSTAKFLAEWKKGPDCAFITTPNSATGLPVPATELEEIAEKALKRQTPLVIDEAFIDFVGAESIKAVIRENPYLIVLRSLTKYYALPGLRIGYLFAQAQRVRQLAAHQEPWSVNGPAQRVALACLSDAGFDLRTREWLERERGFLLEGLSRLKGIRTYPSEANFVLVRMESAGCTALELRSVLLRKKILIRACDSFLGLGRDYFRLAVRRRRENSALLKRLKDLLG